MFGVGPLLLIVILAVVALITGRLYWVSRRGGLTAQQAAEGEEGKRRISLLTEALGYVGAVLVLAGVVAAISQRWDSVDSWGRASVFAGAALFFLLAGIMALRVREPAIQRLAGVVWLLSVAGVAGAVGFATLDARGNVGTYTVLAVGLAAALYSAVLWSVHRQALQNFALFAGLVVTIVGAVSAIDPSASPLAYAFLLWAFGLAWAALGWRWHIEPLWVTVVLGAFLALVAPSSAVGEYGWVYAVGIATAASAMAASVPLQNTPLLSLGALAMFGYVTTAVVRYFHESLGVPGALATTGVVIIVLAIFTARLLRATHPPKPKEPGAEPPQSTQPPKPKEPSREASRHDHLPKAS